MLACTPRATPLTSLQRVSILDFQVFFPWKDVTSEGGVMRTFLLRSLVALALFSVSLYAATVDFNAYGAASGLGYGQAKFVGTSSLVFPGFTLSTTGNGGIQLDAPGYFGATNYELLGGDTLTIAFDSSQSSFSTDVRDFSGFGGTDTIWVYGTDQTTLLNTYYISLVSCL
jgi:hypothetical protein